MRRLMCIALAGWFVIAMTLAQACAGPAQTSAPYQSFPSSGTPVGTTSGGSAATSTASTHIDTTGYSADQKSSEALSEFLKHRRLPLVGAQVLKSPAGQRVVVLYGFVGSDFGKNDAAAKTRTYLADANVPIDNRITVKPELLAGGSSGSSSGSSAEQTASGSPADSQYPGVSSYEQQGSQADQYVQQQTTGSAVSTIAPLLMFGLMALSLGSGGSFMVSPGASPFGGSPFGPVPYNPYPGFPSPSPYSSPYSTVPSYPGGVTPYGGAGSPYTTIPGPFGP